MSKPWEIELTEDQLHRFESVLRDIKTEKVSSICPFDPAFCNRSQPNCASFIKGLRRVDNSSETACPCYKFRPTSLIRRIEKLLKYNNFVQSTNKEGN